MAKPSLKQIMMLTLLFKNQFLSKIRENKKTQTRRLKQPRIKIGKTYNLRSSYTRVLPEKILITDIFQQYLGEISLEDIHKEGFEDLNEFIQVWREIYGNYDPEEIIWVVEFQYVGNTEMFKVKP
jgi:hypothetical protein